jgi:hypothetical protein
LALLNNTADQPIVLSDPTHLTDLSPPPVAPTATATNPDFITLQFPLWNGATPPEGTSVYLCVQSQCAASALAGVYSVNDQMGTQYRLAARDITTDLTDPTEGADYQLVSEIWWADDLAYLGNPASPAPIVTCRFYSSYQFATGVALVVSGAFTGGSLDQAVTVSGDGAEGTTNPQVVPVYTPLYDNELTIVSVAATNLDTTGLNWVELPTSGSGATLFSTPYSAGSPNASYLTDPELGNFSTNVTANTSNPYTLTVGAINHSTTFAYTYALALVTVKPAANQLVSSFVNHGAYGASMDVWYLGPSGGSPTSHFVNLSEEGRSGDTPKKQATAGQPQRAKQQPPPPPEVKAAPKSILKKPPTATERDATPPHKQGLLDRLLHGKDPEAAPAGSSHKGAGSKDSASKSKGSKKP